MKLKIGNKEVTVANSQEGINVLLQSMTRKETNPIVVLKAIATLAKFTSKSGKLNQAAQNAINTSLAFVEAYHADDLEKMMFFATAAIIDDLALRCGGLGSKDPRFDAIFANAYETERASLEVDAPREENDEEGVAGIDDDLLSELESMHDADGGDDDLPWS